jgi:small subunit ribosomal protein S6
MLIKNMQRQYESVIIITPLLTEEQVKETGKRYADLIKKNGGELLNEENWGLRKLAYQIDKKSTGFYYLFEFRSEPELIDKLELEYRRDEQILRFLTVGLDKFGVDYSERRRKGEVGKRGDAKKDTKKENV